MELPSLKLTTRTSKWTVGRRLFPFGMPSFQVLCCFQGGSPCWNDYWDDFWDEMVALQGGPLPVISGVISPINGLING